MTTTALKAATDAQATQPQLHDRYPTRQDDRTTVFDRQDRVVHGAAEAGPMEEATLRHYDEKGYLTIDRLISDEELTTFRAELARLSKDPKVRADEATIVEAASDEVRSIFDIHRTNDVFSRIANDPRIVRRAEQLLGSPVYIHQSRINYKPGFVGKEFGWHSDFETWHAEDGMPSPRAVSISISLTDNHSFNGPLMIMPGSHRKYISCAGGTPEENYKKSLIMQGAGTPDEDTLTRFADDYGIDVLEGPAGGAIMFDSNCMHASNGNVTPYSRSNVFIVYNSVENATVAPYAAPAPRPEFAGSTDFTPAGS
ncbi:ectoine hydroxylase [Brevibacterium jeotgali]|uniref:Ectoine hydroxylase n=1 Tax=Brevibacterium jeotgali TaxID=1262550 RepID=A0A2H1L2F1_9MICO|nr:ectoine hydroxylase [Brevibacterium jeotgali]TWC03055.1 ectoine hydroxylase [Brevibacterium jeotgali]SMY11078.1 ectoine hydroxylase [Brevibacterium jeotgali]